MLVIVQALMTALLSGLFSGAVLFGLNERDKRFEQSIVRHEELFVAFAIWCEAIDDYMATVWDYAQKNRDVFKDSAKNQALFKKTQEAHLKVRLLTEMFLPSLHGISAPVHAYLTKFVPIYHDIQERRHKGEDVPIKEFTDLSKTRTRLHEHKLRGLTAIANEGNAIVTRPPLVSMPMSPKRLWGAVSARLPSRSRKKQAK